MTDTGLRINHRPSACGWTFCAAGRPAIQGGGQTLEASTRAAEHAVRRFLATAHGYEVSLHDARALIEHAHVIPARTERERVPMSG